MDIRLSDVMIDERYIFLPSRLGSVRATEDLQTLFFLYWPELIETPSTLSPERVSVVIVRMVGVLGTNLK